MRDYGRVHSTFWTSATIRSMSEDARNLALYLLTSPHNTIAGVFRLPDGYVCEDIQWSPERVAEGFGELLDKGFANRCETTKWVWICKHLDWNPPENPNQRKSAAKVIATVPDECGWKLDFMRVSAQILGIEPPENPNPSETLAEPFANQEQEQEQEKKQVSASPTGDAPPKADPIPYQAIVDAYNGTMTGLPKVRALTPKRKTLIRRTWQASPEFRSLEFFRDRYFPECQEDPFHNGAGPYRNGHENWQPDFDFLLRPDVVTKVYEKALDAVERGGL